MSLPEACNECAPFGGLWRETPSGMARCKCARGEALRTSQKAAAAPQRNVVPVITGEAANGAVKALTALPFFPSEEMARIMIADELRQMCRSQGELLWLVKRMLHLYRKWPGVSDLRTVYCSKFIPLDGVKAQGISEIFPDGIPSEKEAIPPRALPPGPQTGEAKRLGAALESVKGVPQPGRVNPSGVA